MFVSLLAPILIISLLLSNPPTHLPCHFKFIASSFIVTCYIPKYKLPSLYHVTCMYAFIHTYVLDTSWCALPWRRLFFPDQHSSIAYSSVVLRPSGLSPTHFGMSLSSSCLGSCAGKTLWTHLLILSGDHPHSKLLILWLLESFCPLSQCPQSLLSGSCFVDVSTGPGSTAALCLVVVFCNSLYLCKKKGWGPHFLARSWEGGRCPYLFVNCGKIHNIKWDHFLLPYTYLQPLSRQGAALPCTLGYSAPLSFSKTLKLCQPCWMSYRNKVISLKAPLPHCQLHFA